MNSSQKTIGLAALLMAGAVTPQQATTHVGPAAAFAQTPTTFEAAVIKTRPSPYGPTHFTVLPNRLDVENLSLGFLIQQAYDLPPFQISASDAVVTRHYDVIATSGAPVSKADMRLMLRNLLIERFHLATHWEDKTQAIFHLTVLPGGPKMKTADAGFAMPNSPMRDGNTMQLRGPMSMPQLAERLLAQAGRPVLDATGLDGYFNIDLKFAPDDFDPSKEGVLPALIPTALEEQLGLKLVPTREAIKTLVVDHADSVPVEN
ncbi:MAG TPA: TIGR03435 family protein [Bryobacteraceae bacterium]|nr:TIGR03435 family protein [Bryobacteraceae bacterium]